MNNNFNWVDEKEKQQEEEMSKQYFNIVEGENRFHLLTAIFPLAQVWDNTEKKYRAAQEGDKSPSIKGVCWVLQDNMIKLAKLPYTVVKHLKAYSESEDWELVDFPWPYQITLTAKGAGTKEVEYATTLSPKKAEFSEEILKELSEKDTPEDIIEKMKEKRDGEKTSSQIYNEASKDAPNPDNIPF